MNKGKHLDKLFTLHEKATSMYIDTFVELSADFCLKADEYMLAQDKQAKYEFSEIFDLDMGVEARPFTYLIGRELGVEEDPWYRADEHELIRTRDAEGDFEHRFTAAVTKLCSRGRDLVCWFTRPMDTNCSNRIDIRYNGNCVTGLSKSWCYKHSVW